MYDLDEEVRDKQPNERQERAIFLFLEGKSVSEIAAELGVSRMTLYRWKKDDKVFKDELNRLKRSAWEAGENKLIAARTAAIDAAIDAAIELLAHEDARVKLKAIDTILRFEMHSTWGGDPVLRSGR